MAWAEIDDLGEATAKLVRICYVGKADDKLEYKDELVLFSGPKAYNLTETIDIPGTAAGEKIEIENLNVEGNMNHSTVRESIRGFLRPYD